jgi:hypothetical protein
VSLWAERLAGIPLLKNTCIKAEKVAQKFGGIKKNVYLCIRIKLPFSALVYRIEKEKKHTLQKASSPCS